MNSNDESDRGQCHPDDSTTVSKSRIDRPEGIMPIGTATPPKDDTGNDTIPGQSYPPPMTGQPTPTDEQVEAIYHDKTLTRDQKLTALAALYGITEPITAPELFAHIRGFKDRRPAAT